MEVVASTQGKSIINSTNDRKQETGKTIKRQRRFIFL